jgi:Co/Zn/Cd efflux system component
MTGIVFWFSHAHAHAHDGVGGCTMSQPAAIKEQHHHSHSQDGYDHSLTDNTNKKDIFLHVLTDTLGSVCTLYTNFKIRIFNFFLIFRLV